MLFNVVQGYVKLSAVLLLFFVLLLVVVDSQTQLKQSIAVIKNSDTVEDSQTVQCSCMQIFWLKVV